MIYQSAIDRWLLIVLALGLGLGFVATIGSPVAMLVIFLIAAFFVQLYRSTYYQFDGNTLIIKAGILVHYRVDINSITKLEKSNNILSSPALSLKRIAIHTKAGGYYLISPRRRELGSFLAELEARNAQINIDDQLRQWAAA